MKRIIVTLIAGLLLAGCASIIEVTSPEQFEEINARGAEFPAVIILRANGGDAEYRGDGLHLAGDSARWYDDGAQAWVGVPLSRVHRIRFAKRRTSSGALVGGRSDYFFAAPASASQDAARTPAAEKEILPPSAATDLPFEKPMFTVGYSRGSVSSGAEVSLPYLYMHCCIGSINSVSSSAFGLGGYVQLGRFSLFSGLERFNIDYEPSYSYWSSYYRGRSSSASEGIQWYLGSTYSIPFGEGAVAGGMYVGLSVGSGRGFATGIGMYF